MASKKNIPIEKIVFGCVGESEIGRSGRSIFAAHLKVKGAYTDCYERHYHNNDHTIPLILPSDFTHNL